MIKIEKKSLVRHILSSFQKSLFKHVKIKIGVDDDGEAKVHITETLLHGKLRSDHRDLKSYDLSTLITFILTQSVWKKYYESTFPYGFKNMFHFIRNVRNKVSHEDHFTQSTKFYSVEILTFLQYISDILIHIQKDIPVDQKQFFKEVVKSVKETRHNIKFYEEKVMRKFKKTSEKENLDTEAVAVLKEKIYKLKKDQKQKHELKEGKNILMKKLTKRTNQFMEEKRKANSLEKETIGLKRKIMELEMESTIFKRSANQLKEGTVPKLKAKLALLTKSRDEEIAKVRKKLQEKMKRTVKSIQESTRREAVGKLNERIRSLEKRVKKKKEELKSSKKDLDRLKGEKSSYKSKYKNSEAKYKEIHIGFKEAEKELKQRKLECQEYRQKGIQYKNQYEENKKKIAQFLQKARELKQKYLDCKNSLQKLESNNSKDDDQIDLVIENNKFRNEISHLQEQLKNNHLVMEELKRNSNDENKILRENLDKMREAMKKRMETENFSSRNSFGSQNIHDNMKEEKRLLVELVDKDKKLQRFEGALRKKYEDIKNLQRQIEKVNGEVHKRDVLIEKLQNENRNLKRGTGVLNIQRHQQQLPPVPVPVTERTNYIERSILGKRKKQDEDDNNMCSFQSMGEIDLGISNSRKKKRRKKNKATHELTFLPKREHMITPKF